MNSATVHGSSLALTEAVGLAVDIGGCHKCQQLFSTRFVDPRNQRQKLEVRPIFGGMTLTAPILLIGQAPGIMEYERRAAFQGAAGRAIKGVFAAAGLPEPAFDTV